jgi:hypothetical protein
MTKDVLIDLVNSVVTKHDVMYDLSDYNLTYRDYNQIFKVIGVVSHGKDGFYLKLSNYETVYFNFNKDSYQTDVWSIQDERKLKINSLIT